MCNDARQAFACPDRAWRPCARFGVGQFLLGTAERLLPRVSAPYHEYGCVTLCRVPGSPQRKHLHGLSKSADRSGISDCDWQVPQLFQGLRQGICMECGITTMLPSANAGVGPGGRDCGPHHIAGRASRILACARLLPSNEATRTGCYRLADDTV